MLKGIFTSLGIEILKIRKSMIFRIITGAACFISLMFGMMILFIKYPDMLPPGLLKSKVNLAAITADWPSYFSLLEQAAGALGMIIFGFVASWIFGREYMDRTIKDILSLPTTRATIVTAKTIAMMIWCIIISLLICIISVAVGVLISLPLWSPALFADFLRIYWITTLLTLFLCPPVAYVASAGRGPFPAIGFAIITMGLANLVGNFGWGAYFPWTIPMMYTGAVGGPGTQLYPVSYIILCLAGIAGFALTVYQWKYKDHH